ncbi:MAG: ATP-binding protein [Coleofasciculaceae cyanobacterium]
MSGSNRSKDAAEMLVYGGLLHRITNRIRQSLELEDILSATVVEVRSLLRTDRVKIYRFHPDGSGQVVAESVDESCLPSLLGLNFPASDIPPQAREMYLKARQRSLVDVLAETITLSSFDTPPPTTGELTVEEVRQLPLRDIIERPVDPCHVKYLTAMGITSSLVVPIFHEQYLWGLLVSHHSHHPPFSEQDMQLVQPIADQLSIAIAQSTLLSQTRERVRQETTINQITSLLHSLRNIEEVLQLVLERIVEVIGGSGGRLYLPATDISPVALYSCGTQPNLSVQEGVNFLEEDFFWQQLIQPLEESSLSADFSQLQVISDVYKEPQLESARAVFQPTQIRGMLAIPLQYNSSESLGCLTIFRNAVDREILWAGYWDHDERQERPRQSFEVWREEKKNQAPAWNQGDIELIQALAMHLAMTIMQNRLHQLEKHNLELKLARAAAEESSRMKSAFLASTSHELRTPLASTLNCLQIIKKGLYKNPEDFNKYIQLADKSAKNLVSIVNDVLDIAKIEAGHMSVDWEQVSLKFLLEEQRDLFSLESQQKDIPLIIECEVDQVYADQSKLRQILTNLLSNAFKFTETGEVRLKITQAVSQSRVEFSVTDTGIGIEMQQKLLLLEPFVQEDGSIKRRYGGTGLGLSICKRFVELMGGQIWLDSLGKNQGTKVTFTLPYISNSEPPQ